MAENAVQIGVRTGTRGDLQGGEGSAQPSPHEPDPQAAARFGQALAQAPQAHAHQAAPGRLLSPFELLGAVPQADAAPMSGGDAPQTSLLNWLQDCASRLLVGEGQDGRREVRITLDERLLPGVTVALYEDAGAWVADLCCSDASSYETLARPASDMARQMALALNRDVLWRVTLDTPSGDAPGAVEAFASCP